MRKYTMNVEALLSAVLEIDADEPIKAETLEDAKAEANQLIRQAIYEDQCFDIDDVNITNIEDIGEVTEDADEQ